MNLNITHGLLQTLMCHNSLWSVLCGCSLSKWLICKDENKNLNYRDFIFPFLRRETFGHPLILRSTKVAQMTVELLCPQQNLLYDDLVHFLSVCE